ncbi:FUSC_2 domain-containing protein [Cephalotus follicularis]|uniref:FUSC_2 domain-containing protein n=1 Tax=Cephalotus follicularis TaxID=3775 RepID=A0A1Q3B3Z9_CEPFO|nr:FUSC_2 domain-containing protein [Cephalotus follicularis]
MSTTTTTTKDQIKALWRMRLGSALRTTLACTIVCCITLFGPEPLRKVLAYPAFSYVTTILIVSDATLGDTLRGCWHALYATIQVIIPSIITLYVITPERFNCGLAAAAVAFSSFLVALPRSTHLMAKRIAFGQIVIVYLGTVIHGAQTGVVMHPLHVACSTALGAFASVLAMLFPFPRLAYYEVSKTCRLYAENASERLNLLVKAFTAQDNPTALDFVFKSKLISETGAKHLQSIKKNQEGMLWERPQIRLLKPNRLDPGLKLEGIEIPIRGMEIALTSFPSLAAGMLELELKDFLLSTKVKIGLKLEQAKRFAPFDSTTAPEIKEELLDGSLWTRKAMSATHEDLPAFFVVYCMTLLQDDPISGKPDSISKTTQKSDSREQPHEKSGFKKGWSNLMMNLSSESLVFAFKCSLSLGLAVLFGLIYNKKNGYWSGLTIAISFVTRRQATFTVANSRAQGTAMGSVYGILCCFIFQGFEDLRFLPLLPWIIFTSLLRHSRMYGQSGGIAAVIGALLILGRKNYGTPSEFAITRITEATIGLICFITVEILLHRARASSLAKAEVSKCLGVLEECIGGLVLGVEGKNMSAANCLPIREKHRRLKSHVNKLETFIAEAESEPNFWFHPFHGACHRELLGSLSKMVDILAFIVYECESLSQMSRRFGNDWTKQQELLNDDLARVKGKVGYLLKCLKVVVSIKSLDKVEKEMQTKNVSQDIELGKSPNADFFRNLDLEEEAKEIMTSFSLHLKELSNRIIDIKDEEKFKCQTVLCLSSLGFCMGNLIRETIKIEKKVRELLTWENPTRQINLYEIYGKIKALDKL